MGKATADQQDVVVDTSQSRPNKCEQHENGAKMSFDESGHSQSWSNLIDELSKMENSLEQSDREGEGESYQNQ